MKRIGTDESGKGDYFGCLVVAAVYVDEQSEEKLKRLGVKDSKLMSDSEVIKISGVIKAIPNEVIAISPKRYNELYEKFRNINIILGWAHAKAISNLCEKTKCMNVIVDKFSKKDRINGHIKDKKIKITEKEHAESDTAVAAASVLARSVFLESLRALSRQIGYKLPKGATHVEEALKHLKENYEEGVLKEVAKIHFRITKK